MRIALVEFNPSGGLFQFALQMGEALADRGHQVELITGPRPEFGSTVPGMTVASILPTWHPGDAQEFGPLRQRVRRVWRAGCLGAAWIRLAQYLRHTPPDVVQWSSWRFPLDGWAVRRIARSLPDVVMADLVHSPRAFVERGDGLYKRGRLLDVALRSAYEAMDVAFVLGEHARTDFLDAWPTAGPVEVLPHGDEEVLSRGVELLPAGECGPVVLFFGTWTRYKGLEVLLRAFRLVRDSMPEARLVVAGDVSADLDMSVVRRLATRAGGVDLRPGYVPASDVGGLVGAARVVVLPYRAIYQSGVAHLAQTFARPVVATRVGDLPAVVRDGQSGVLVPPEDPSALAGGLLRLLRDPALATRYGAAGRADLAARGSWARTAEIAERHYARLTSHPLIEAVPEQLSESATGAQR